MTKDDPYFFSCPWCDVYKCQTLADLQVHGNVCPKRPQGKKKR